MSEKSLNIYCHYGFGNIFGGFLYAKTHYYDNQIETWRKRIRIYDDYLLFIYLMFTGAKHMMPLTGDNSTIVASTQITVQIPNYY